MKVVWDKEARETLISIYTYLRKKTKVLSLWDILAGGDMLSPTSC